MCLSHGQSALFKLHGVQTNRLSKIAFFAPEKKKIFRSVFRSLQSFFPIVVAQDTIKIESKTRNRCTLSFPEVVVY